MANDRRFAFLIKLRRDPPFWFHHALAFCKFEQTQLQYLVENSIERFDDQLFGEPSLSETCSPSDIQCAIECGLIEPIFRSIAEYTGDIKDVMELLQVCASRNTGSRFPWMFLAYLGACYHNVHLVQRCIDIIFEEKEVGKVQEFAMGMSYQVWRFLINGEHEQLHEEWRSTFLELPLAKHDWTFVHLASAYGDVECLEILLNRPCHRNMEVMRIATKVEGFTPLHLAAFYNHAAIVQLLLEHADKFTLAAPDGQESMQEEILSQTIPRDRIFERSPLHIAASVSNVTKEVLSILIDKWGSVGVDLPDRFGITALHLAIASRNDIQFKMLLEASKNPFQRVRKDFALQKAALLRLFPDSRRYIDDPATSSSLFIPSPSTSFISRQFLWFDVGFTILHTIAIYGSPEQFYEVLKHHSAEASLKQWAARDCQGLTPVDYADAQAKFNPFLRNTEAARKVETFGARVSVLLNREKALSQIMKASQLLGEARLLSYVYSLGGKLLSGDYDTAVLHSAWETFQTFQHLSAALRPWKWAVDDEAWDHVEWALDKALQADILSAENVQLKGGPRLHPSQAEQIVLHLAVHRNLLRGKSSKQRCLQWAIGKRMVGLAVELVKDTECELVSVVPGSKHEESPLARASKSKVGTNGEMSGLLAVMELREDVKRRWFEDRQVYVDYANTLLVGAVLIAGLAFAGWLQPPRGYVQEMGVIDMKRHTMRMFVYSSSLAFFLGMGTMVAGATGAIPFAIGSGQLVRARDKVHRSILIASILLVASIICLSLSFAAALLAVLPSPQITISISVFLAINGLWLSGMLFNFLRRLRGLGWSLIMPCLKLLAWST